MCHTCSRRVHPEETSVLTGHSCCLIANSFTDDLARHCDDALRGGIRDQKQEKQKDDEQTRLTSRRSALRRNLPTSLTAEAIHKHRTTHFRFSEWCLARAAGVDKDWPLIVCDVCRSSY